MGRKRASKKRPRHRGTKGRQRPREEEPAFVGEELSRFIGQIAQLRLPEALDLYFLRLEALTRSSLEELLQGRDPVCEAGCDTCCHQPLILSLVELAAIYFSDEPTLGGDDFHARVLDELATLARWRGQGAQTPVELARLQWAEQRPCLLLRGGECSIHPVRPDICRNAFAEERCTPTSLNTFGFGNIATLSSRMQRVLWRRFGLARFASQADFLLPEGLAWLREQAPLEEMRPLWLGEVDYLPGGLEPPPPLEERGDADGPSLLPLPGARHECRCCGEGCKLMEIGPLDQRDIARLQSHDYGRLGVEGGVDIVMEVDTTAGPALFMNKEQGACILQDRQSKRCRVHEVYGLEAKPRPCQAFPLRLTRAPGGIRLSLMPACLERHATFSSGPPLSEQLDQARWLVSLGLGRDGPFSGADLENTGQATMPLLPDLHLAWPAYLALERDTLSALASREEPVEQILAGVLRGLHDHALPDPLAPALRTEQARGCMERFFTLLQQGARGQDTALARVAGRLGRGDRVGPSPWRRGCETDGVQALAAEFMRHEIWALESLRLAGSLLPGLVLLAMTHVASCWVAVGSGEQVDPAGYNRAFARVDGMFRRLDLHKPEALVTLAADPSVLLRI